MSAMRSFHDNHVHKSCSYDLYTIHNIIYTIISYVYIVKERKNTLLQLKLNNSTPSYSNISLTKLLTSLSPWIMFNPFHPYVLLYPLHPCVLLYPPPPLNVVDPFPIELDRVVDAQKLGIDGVYPTLNPRQGSFLLFPYPLTLCVLQQHVWCCKLLVCGAMV